MWIHVYPNGKTNFNSKNGNKRSSSCETKASISLIPMRSTCLWCQSWKERRLLYEFVFIQIERWTSIPKMIIGEAFLIKPKHQYHLSQQEECIYGAQSWKERLLLYESMFIPIERWTSILKMIIRDVFLRKPKHQYHLSHQGKCVCGAQSWKERR